MAGQDTEARRERVRRLWLKSDREIAETLIDEGYGGPAKRTKEAKARRLASMQRNVWNDREALKKKWRETKRSTTADVYESRGEHLAVLDSLQDIGIEMLGDSKLKGTPKAQALQAVTRIVEAKGKALGVAEVAPELDPDDGKVKPLVIGLRITGLDSLTAEEKDRARELGIDV